MADQALDSEQGAEIVPLHPDGAGQLPPGTGSTVEPVPARDGGTAPHAPVPTETPGERRPVVPPPLQRANIRATIHYHAGLTWHRVRYHVLRLPLYAARMVMYAIAGAARLTGDLLLWASWADGKVLESQAVAAGRTGHAEAMAAHKQGNRTRGTRLRIVAACTIATLAAFGVALDYLPLWAWSFVVASLTALLIRAGKPSGKRLAAAAVVPAKYAEPTQEIILNALAALGLTPLTRAILEGRGPSFVTPVHRDGPGWGVRLEMPQGVDAVHVINKRNTLAGALRRPLSATWPLPVNSEHPGMLDLWIGFTALNKQPPVKWPLSDAGKADLFQPIPFGADQRGNIVTILLMFASVLIGAMPRMGKTFALRVIALAVALDPNARVRVWELKGTGDLAALKHVAHEYGSGADRETLEACLASVRGYAGQLDKRAKRLRELPPELVPENKVTPDVCAKRSLGLYPDVLIIDEVQEAFADKELGGQFTDLLVPVTKRGPALGMMLVLATQRPDKDSLPTAISSNIGIRFCLKVMSYIASNMVLGDGMSTQGFNAADFTRSDKGIGWLTGETDDPQIVRGCYIDAPKAEKIALRARAARIAAGTLTGFAAGESDGTPARDFLADVLTVFGTDTNLWLESIAARLTGQVPEAYPLITKEAVGSQLRAAGVTVKDVRESGARQRKGCSRADVAAVAGEQGQP